MNTIRFVILLVATALAVTATQIQDGLARAVPFFSQDEQPIGAVLQSLGRANGLSIIADPDVSGTVSVEMSNTTVKGVLEAILRPNGYFYEVQDGWISVQRNKTVIYAFDYPQLSRSGTSNSSISLGGSSTSGSNGENGGNGQTGMNFVGAGSNALSSAVNGANGSNGSGSGDTTQISISQKNDSDFFASIEAQIKGMLSKEGRLVVNRFSGIVQVTDNERVHESVRAFVHRVNGRIGAQVEISASIVEVSFNSQKQAGIDWSVAAFKIGGVSVGSAVTAPSDGTVVTGLTAPTNVSTVNGLTLAAPTIAGTLSTGGVSAVIRALQEQGTVHVKNQPRIRLLNNQSGFIKDAIDQPFFDLDANVTINAGGTAIGGAQPITQTRYTKEIISIGLVVPVTVQIAENDLVTLDLTPSLTRLLNVAHSPDGTQTAAVLDVKQTSTIVKLHSGETAVIGGLISSEDDTDQRKIPFLGDLPGIGAAFRSNGKTSTRSELVILLTPTVIRYGDDGIRIPSVPLAAIVAPMAPSAVETISVP